MASINYKRGNLGICGKIFTAIECAQFHNEVDVHLTGVHFFNKLVAGGHGATGGKQVIVYDHNVVGRYGIAVNLDFVKTILLLKLRAHS